MTEETRTAEPAPYDEVREKVIEAALAHVVFDGWSKETLEAAIADSGVDAGMAHLAFPRPGLDLALGFHRMMDRRLAGELAGKPQPRGMTDKITHAVLRRIELVAQHRDAVRRGASLFALPPNMALGARAMWETADTIWTACGDTSTDYNWYSKRAILSGVYSSTVLYWLGDSDPEMTATRAFLDRRIGDVMQFEKTKAQLRDNPVARTMLWGPRQILGMIRAPGAGGAGGPAAGLGRWPVRRGS